MTDKNFIGTALMINIQLRTISNYQDKSAFGFGKYAEAQSSHGVHSTNYCTLFSVIFEMAAFCFSFWRVNAASSIHSRWSMLNPQTFSIVRQL